MDGWTHSVQKFVDCSRFLADVTLKFCTHKIYFWDTTFIRLNVRFWSFTWQHGWWKTMIIFWIYEVCTKWRQKIYLRNCNQLTNIIDNPHFEKIKLLAQLIPSMPPAPSWELVRHWSFSFKMCASSGGWGGGGYGMLGIDWAITKL